MQVRDNNAQLLYGLFQSISSWAMDMGYKDISSMKNLLKLAMVDACRKRHEDKKTLASQMAVVADLGISLRNVQYSLKKLEEIKDLASGFVKIREIQKEITVILLAEPQTAEQILNEVTYLIHAPHELQKRTLRTILQDMEKKHIIVTETKNNEVYYKIAQPHVSLFDPTDLSARVSGLLTHIDAFNHTISDPLFKIYHMDQSQATGLQTAVNEFLLGTGNAYELECREAKSVTKPYYFYLGSAPSTDLNHQSSIADAMLEVIKTRFSESESPSTARNYWYHLTPSDAQAVFAEVRNFIEREGKSASQIAAQNETIPFAFYFGLADLQSRKSLEEI